MKINLQYAPSASLNWTKEYMVKVLTTGDDAILTDPMLINAFLKIDRKDFMPEKLEHLAYNDLEIDIGYGEKLNKPTAVAQMLTYLKPKFGGKYLDIGSGTGYVAMLLGFVAGDAGHVYSIERIQWLWEIARQNAQKYPNIRNVEFLYRDGKEGLVQKAPYDGIHVAFAFNEIPESLKTQLKVNGGILVCPTEDYNVRVVERKSIDEYEEEIVSGFVFDKGKEGLA